MVTFWAPAIELLSVYGIFHICLLREALLFSPVIAFGSLTSATALTSASEHKNSGHCESRFEDRAPSIPEELQECRSHLRLLMRPKSRNFRRVFFLKLVIGSVISAFSCQEEKTLLRPTCSPTYIPFGPVWPRPIYSAFGYWNTVSL